jgi:formate dehydrogenase subunit delta
MDVKRLTYMANQIAEFFGSYPEHEAVTATAVHLHQFWDGRMRDQLARHAAAGGEGLTAIALAAVRQIQEQEPEPDTSR